MYFKYVHLKKKPKHFIIVIFEFDRHDTAISGRSRIFNNKKKGGGYVKVMVIISGWVLV